MPDRNRLLMFDLDGTLIDSLDDLCTAVNLLRQDYGLTPLSTKKVSRYVGEGMRILVERALRGYSADLDEATGLCARHYWNHWRDHTRLYPGVREGLFCLSKADYLLALISNKPAATCREILDYFDIEPCFACILGAGDVQRLKPHPEPLLTAMTRMQATPNESWMIGDHRTDLEAARHAGVRSIWLTYGIGERGQEQPTRVFDSFRDLTIFFERGNGTRD